jgi:CRISPR-associated protein Csx3
LIQFKTEQREGFVLVTFDIEGGVCSPDDLIGLEVPEVPLDQGVVISGRGQWWLFAFLVHEYHPALWVGTHDPRLGGGVVVQSHTKDVTVGQAAPI